MQPSDSHPSGVQPPDVLHCDRIELRRWHADMIEGLDRAITESREHLRPWMPFAATHDRAQGEGFLAFAEKEWLAGEGYNYAILSDGVVVGSCGLHRRIGPHGLEIGYWLHHAWTGQGLATMAAAALVRAAGELPGIDHVEIHHDEANVASGAVARRLGFTEVARIVAPDRQAAPGETGVDLIWRLAVRAEASAAPA
ncbi:GNAT family N-acetyltransferase [Streptomyces sp. NBC_00102]|uniref:GNAT family N-acetyltransferase n=1 Tax=Streptomyces sp. NBC_00102 TaxID=2975652 RepID=UPI002250B664|nr:GNAT family N-acetyltransferase [Streptomyces sp. NBC_00102]MCX5398935.1 GNAT family N-acetyltransferase [Streptomyces sp. NBC_00102]